MITESRLQEQVRAIVYLAGGLVPCRRVLKALYAAVSSLDQQQRFERVSDALYFSWCPTRLIHAATEVGTRHTDIGAAWLLWSPPDIRIDHVLYVRPEAVPHLSVTFDGTPDFAGQLADEVATWALLPPSFCMCWIFALEALSYARGDDETKEALQGYSHWNDRDNPAILAAAQSVACSIEGLGYEPLKFWPQPVRHDNVIQKACSVPAGHLGKDVTVTLSKYLQQCPRLQFIEEPPLDGVPTAGAPSRVFRLAGKPLNENFEFDHYTEWLKCYEGVATESRSISERWNTVLDAHRASLKQEVEKRVSAFADQQGARNVWTLAKRKEAWAVGLGQHRSQQLVEHMAKRLGVMRTESFRTVVQHKLERVSRVYGMLAKSNPTGNPQFEFALYDTFYWDCVAVAGAAATAERAFQPLAAVGIEAFPRDEVVKAFEKEYNKEDKDFQLGLILYYLSMYNHPEDAVRIALKAPDRASTVLTRGGIVYAV